MQGRRQSRRSSLATTCPNPRQFLSRKFALKMDVLKRSHSAGWLPEFKVTGNGSSTSPKDKPATGSGNGGGTAGAEVGAGVGGGGGGGTGALRAPPAVGRGLTKGISMVEQTVLDMDTNLPAGILKKRPSLTGGSSLGEQRSLHQISRDGDICAMKSALDSMGLLVRHHVNRLNEDRLSPLHIAARYNHYHMVKLLVEYGAIVHIRGEDGLTPLHFAARYRGSKQHSRTNLSERSASPAEIQEELEGDIAALDNDDVFTIGEEVQATFDNQLRSGAKTVETVNRSARNVGTQLQKLRQQKAVRSSSSDDFLEKAALTRAEENGSTSENAILYLVSQLAEVNSKDDYGLTPLHYTAMRGIAAAARDLLSCPAINVEATDAENMTALHLAAVHNNPEIARVLIDAGANLRCRDEHMATPLHRAAAEGNLEIALMLLDAAEERDGTIAVGEMVADQDHDRSTALHLAVESGYLSVVDYLMAKGADVNVARQNFVYPLHLATTAGDVDIVLKLLESNDRIDCLNANGETPLHRAAEFNHAAVIDILVKNGADIERKDKNDFTPLLMASSHGHVESIEALLKLGANLQATDKDEKTAIYWAVQQNKPNAVMTLFKDPISHNLISRTDRYGNSLLHIATLKGYLFITQCLLDLGAPIELKNEMEQTPLHLAAWHGRTKIVKDLIRHSKTAINSEDEEGNSPLHMAALAGHDNVIQALLEVGANIEGRNSHLWTALDCAASRGFINSVRILLEAGCPIDPQEKTKITPLHLAAGSGSVDVVLLLLENGANISRRDDQGRNCLEIAIDHAKRDVAKAIVQSDYWAEALRCESYDVMGMKQTPLRLLIKKMPDVAEDVLNRCSQKNDLPPEHPLYAVSFNYELLDDTYITFEKHDSDGPTPRGSLTDDSLMTKSTQKLATDPAQYSYYGSLLKENHPLMLMVRGRRQKLLAHPLCVSLLHLKWVSFGRYVYYVNLLFYLLFLAFLTGYVLTTPAPGKSQEEKESKKGNDSSPTPHPSLWTTGNETVPDEVPTTESHAAFQDCPYPVDVDFVLDESLFSQVGKYAIIALVTIHLVKEFFQLYMIRLNYLNFENLMEWACYVTALLLVVDFSKCSFQTGLRERWQWQVGAFAIFLAWMNLVLFISKFPYLGLYVVMFFDVFTTFCKVCVVFFIFILAFAFGFHMVMYYQEPYNTAAKSIVRTMAMMLGEFQFDDLFADDLLRYPVPSYFFFVALIVLICLITMNLLVGLAVDDIKSVQAQASLKRLAMQVELVLNVESVLPKMLQERFVIRERSFMTNRRKKNLLTKIFDQVNNTHALYEALASPEKVLNSNSIVFRCKLSEVERILEQQEMLLNRTLNMENVVTALQSENQKLQHLMTTLLHHQGVRWEDEDK